MARVDVPTLKCDRCGWTTQDKMVMSRFNALTGQWDGYQGAHQKWDLCETCWTKFLAFIGGSAGT